MEALPGEPADPDQSQHVALPETATAGHDGQTAAWTDVAASSMPQLDATQQLALLQQQQQVTQITPEQLAALTALNGSDLSGLNSSEILQRLMVAPAEAAPAEQQTAMNIQLPRAPDLVSTSFMMDGTTAAEDGQAGAQADPGAGAAEPTAAAAKGEPTPDSVAAAVAAAAAAAAAAGVAGDAGAALQLQLQQQHGIKRKAGDALEPPADSDVADILLAMAGNPKQKAAAAGAADANAAAMDGSGLPSAAVQDGTAGAGAAAAGGEAAGGQVSALDPNAAAAAAAANGSATMEEHNQPMAISMAGGTLTDASGNVLDLSSLTASQLSAVSAGLPGLPVGMQGLAVPGMLQIATAGGTQGYATLPGMQTLQLVQLPLQGDLAALQQAGFNLGAAATEEQQDGRPLKRARGGDGPEGEAAGSDARAAGIAEDGTALNGVAGGAGEGVIMGADDTSDGGGVQVLDAAAAAGGVHGLSEQQMDELQQQAADVNAAAAAATALGTVVNVNGVNMLIPAAPQLQLQLAPGDNMQDQLLALQQQVQLAHIPVVSGLGGVQLPAGMTNLAGASPEQMQQLQQQIQIQQQIQQLQLQQQLQIMQLQLASQQGIVLAGPGGMRMDGDTSGHMVRRHGVLPERLVTRDMLKQVFHLPIEEAAKSLGIGQTMLKHYCRKFGIPRWPYRKRQSVVQLIQSIESYAQTQDKPMAVEPALAKLRSFLEQIDEDPNIDLDAPIKRLRQAFFKEAYKARVRKQQSESGEEGRGRGGGGGGGRTTGRTEAWLENLCQAIVESHPDLPAAGHHGGGFGDMGDDDYRDDEADGQHHHMGHDGSGVAAEHDLAGLHHHTDPHVAAAAAVHGLDPNAIALSLASVAQLAGQQGGLDDPALVAAAAQAHAEQLAALEAAAAASAEAGHEQ